MAAYQAFSGGYGNSQDCLGQELPPSLPPHGSLAERQNQDPEKWHVILRAFSSTKELDPVKALQTLSKLCHLWLRLDLHTKEQILEKLVLEQFLISMPLELQVLVKENNVHSCNDLMVMLINQEKPKKWFIASLLKKVTLSGVESVFFSYLGSLNISFFVSTCAATTPAACAAPQPCGAERPRRWFPRGNISAQ